MGKKAIVTGGSKGIGSGIVRRLAGQGYDIVFSYAAHGKDAFTVRDEVRRQYGTDCECFQAALDIRGNGKIFFDQAIAYLGGLDLLVNNAGVTIFESVLDLTEENMDRMINLNFRNYCILMHEATQYMAQNGIKGSIVNITSTRGERAYPQDGIYGGIKAGLNRAIQSFALDAAPYGIRINNVAPGAIRIRSGKELQEMMERIGGDPTVDFWDELGNRIPLERSGLPEDIAGAVVFLASDEASYITGVTLRVDGGLILPGMPEMRSPEMDDHGWGYSKKRMAD